MNNISIITRTFEDSIKETVCSIHEFENVPNSQVYKVETETKKYIFKIYAQRDWPEDGKLPYITKKLSENNIAHAKIFDFNRDNEHFPNGYLIEELLPGVTADELDLSFEENIKLYEKLGRLVSQVHKIRLTNYGFIGGKGIADWTTFSEFIYDMFKDTTSILRDKNIFDSLKLTEIREKLYEKLKSIDCYPPVICHGDLSTKNILVNSDDVVLIDWDDAQSLCWIADIARLTFWMKLKYDEKTNYAYRNAFLNAYETEYDKSVYDKFENALHVWYGLDYLNFAAGRDNYKSQCESLKAILEEVLVNF